MSRFYCSERGCARRWIDVRTATCRACGHANTRVSSVEGPGRPNMIPGVQPHWNDAFGCEVRSGRHLKQLQKQHGTVDFEPVGKDAAGDSPAAQWRRDWHRRGTARHF